MINCNAPALGSAAVSAYMAAWLWFSDLGFMQPLLRAMKKKASEVKPAKSAYLVAALQCAVYALMIGFIYEFLGDTRIPHPLAHKVALCFPPAAALGVALLCVFYAVGTFDMVIWEKRHISQWLIIAGGKTASLMAAFMGYHLARRYM